MFTEESKIDLSTAPADQAGLPVACWSEPLVIDTYEPGAPEEYPQVLDNRVYQGSSGKVFPLPFHERIEPEKAPHAWEAVHLENRWMRVVILPELGGRIHIAYDKTVGYDIFYRNNVIKPALVGLTGPWIAGGVEFNWPQHHRPATYLPTDVAIEREADGSVTVWCSDHDPFARMKGMHGIRLRPGSSAIEARVRLFNRSEERQTFLWWANVAAAVGDHYQSFFLTDVHHFADHAKRAVATFPAVSGVYYGVDYPARVDKEHPHADRIDWYRNIPLPTSYMVTDTDDAFFGGYDHSRRAGFVHWADRGIAPGKKQWTWGNAPFGHAWDTNLTDTDGPYVELMAGVFTDNQPDFSFLEPGETKTLSQFWYPISEIGPPLQATREAAVRIEAIDVDTVRIGVSASIVADAARVILTDGGCRTLHSSAHNIAPGSPAIIDVVVPEGVSARDLVVRVEHGAAVLVEHAWRERGDDTSPASAVAPPSPAEVATVEELHFVATYLQQYRHATRSPRPYWEEALRRDPGDVRSNVALGILAYGEARYEKAIARFETAIERETAWAPNPESGRAHYCLGLALRRVGRVREARRAFEKATWNAATAVPAHLALARDLASPEPLVALDHARQAFRQDVENLQVRDVLTVLLRRLKRADEASGVLEETLRIDPLDQWARHLAGLAVTDDATILIDVALEYASVGDGATADRLFGLAQAAASRRPLGQVNVGPLAGLHRAAAALRREDLDTAGEAILEAAALDTVHALPNRLDDVDALLAVAKFDPKIAVAHAMLGSWYFDRGRVAAVDSWTRGLEAAPVSALQALLHRNLGVAAYNDAHDSAAALEHFTAARTARPDDARLLYESDELAARTDENTPERLARLEADPELVRARDDLSVERARLLTEVGPRLRPATYCSLGVSSPGRAVKVSSSVLGMPPRSGIARDALADGNSATAVDALERMMALPESLGEARHPLATTADLHVALGDAYTAAGRDGDARRAWEIAAGARGDFTDMATVAFTERSAWSIVALQRLGRSGEAAAELDAFERFIDEEAVRPAEIDYFATSLPTMLLFHDDLTVERNARSARLRELRTRLTEHLTSRPPDVSQTDRPERRTRLTDPNDR